MMIRKSAMEDGKTVIALLWVIKIGMIQRGSKSKEEASWYSGRDQVSKQLETPGAKGRNSKRSHVSNACRRGQHGVSDSDGAGRGRRQREGGGS